MKDLTLENKKNIYQKIRTHLPRNRRDVTQPRFFQLVLLYFILMAAGSVVAIGKNLMFAKILSVSAFGYLALFNIAVSFGTNFIHLGLLNGLNRELPVALGRGEEERAVLLRNMVITALAFLLLLFLVPYTAAVFIWAGEDLKVKTILLIASLAVTVKILYQITALELRGRQMLVPFSLIYLLQGLFTLGAGIVGGIYWGLKGVVVAVVLGSVVAVATAWYIWLDRMRFVRLDFKEIKYLLRIGVPLLVSLLCASFIFSMDRLFVAGLFGFETLGHYQFAALVFTAGQMLAGIIGQWVTPQVLYDHGRGVSPKKNFYRVITIMGVILGIFLIGWYPFAVAAGFLIERFFPRYLEAISYLNIFYLAAGFTTINLTGVVLNALNRQRLIMIGVVFVTIVLVLSYLIAGWLEAPLIAFAWIFLSGQVLLVGVNLWLVYRCLRQER